MLFHRKRISN